MNTFRHDPDGAENQSATEQNEREVRVLQITKGQSLPHVCPCGALLDAAGVWSKPEALPPKPHSHGACPECVEAYRAALRAATATMTRKHKMRGGRGG